MAGIDTDDVIKPVLKDILRLYHEKHEGYMLSFGTFHIIPRQIVTDVGGWRNIQWYEDVDFAKRVELRGKIHYFNYSSHIIERGNVKRSILYRLKDDYRFRQCLYRLRLSVFTDIGKNPWYMRPLQFLNAMIGITIAKIKRLHKFEY